MPLAPLHPLSDRILVRAGEGRKHQRARIGLAVVYRHAGDPLVQLGNGGDIFKVELRVHPLRIEIKRQGDDVHITGALAVAEQGALHPLSSGEHSHLGICDGAAAVVVRVLRQYHRVAVFEVLVHIFDLAGVDMRHREGHRHRQVDDRLFIRRRPPYVQHRVADFQRKFHLGPGEALRGILEPVRIASPLGVLLQELRAAHRDLDDLLLRLLEHLLPLRH